MKTYYLICSSPRSGTNILRHLLLSCKMGMPVEIDPEYLNLQNTPVAKVPSSYNIKYLHNFMRGANFIPKSRDTGNVSPAIYSRIVWGFQFRELIDNLRRAGEVPNDIQDKHVLDHLYPNIKYIYLYRRDKVRQAVSLEMARQSGEWLVTNRGAGIGFNDYKYDAGILAQEVLWRLDGEVVWKQIFDDFGISPLVIEYECFVKSMESTLSEIARHLELEFNGMDVQEILNHPDAPIKQDNPIKHEWKNLFLRDMDRIADYRAGR